MNYLKIDVLLAGVMLVSGCTGLNVTQSKQSLFTDLNHHRGKHMQSINYQQETIIRLIQETIIWVQKKAIIDNETKLLGENHDNQNKILEDKEYQSYRFMYGRPKAEISTSEIYVTLTARKNSQGHYETRKASIDVSSGAYKTNFPYDIFLDRLGLKRYREYSRRGVRTSVTFPNAKYGHWMHGDAYFVYPYQTTGHPEIAVVAMIIESGNGGSIDKQTVRGDINMDYPLNVESIEIYVK